MMISVRVKSRAKTRSITQESTGGYLIHTPKVREDGKANDDVVDIVAEHFSVPKSRVIIKSGHRASRKIIEIQA